LIYQKDKMPPSPYSPLFELTRARIVESVHYGAVAVVDGQGQIIASYGDPYAVTYMRSSAKPLQALPFVEEGGQTHFHLTLREIALICASHAGTDEHVEVVKSIQEKTGVAESDLLCGIHPLSHKPTDTALRQRGEKLTPNRHNCSGKHTGMLAFARMLNLPTSNYIDPEHPVQVKIHSAISELCGLPPERIAVGIDGCSAPNFATPLYNAALAVARLCDPENALPRFTRSRLAACHTITQAMLAYPDMVGGPNSFDTHLMTAAQGRMLAKAGAEGYQVIGLMPGVYSPGSPGLGIAYKISDGDLKARYAGEAMGLVRPAVALEILRQLGVLTPEMSDALTSYGPEFSLYNWRKLLVGQGRPCFELQH